MSFVDESITKKKFEKKYRRLTIEDIQPGKEIVAVRDVERFANNPNDEIHIFGPYIFANPTIKDGIAHYEKDGKNFSCSLEDILNGESSDGLLYRCFN